LPRKAAELGALAVKRLALPGLFAVGGVTGLALQVKETGSRSWILRITTSRGLRREIGLGGYPDISLSVARDLARRLREEVAQGIDPVEERRKHRVERRLAAKALTFSEAAVRWHSVRTHEYRNPKHAAQVISTLRTYADPHIADVPVKDVELRHVLMVLEPIWTTKTETADRVRGRIENVLAWAGAAGHRSGENPARWRGNLDALLPHPSKISKVAHHPALPIDEMPNFMSRLCHVDGMGARALEFLVLTAARSGEVRGAVWSEIDLDARVWIIPADRMKAGREHRVPLSDEACRRLERLPRVEGSQQIFPSARGLALSDMTISAVMRRMGVDAVPHGIRSSFRDWVAERTSYPTEVAEMALAHTIGNKVEAAYRRGDLFEKRRAMMRDWADFCRPPP
jgi:integrase